MIYESFLLFGVLCAAFVLPHVLLGVFWKAAVPGALLWMHVLLVQFVYFGWLWKRNGQTLAMQTWKIRLVSADGATPTVKEIVMRYVLAWPSLMVFGLGILWALIDRDRQFLHDRLAGTRLIRT